jgi:hypothetical protein
VGQEILYCFKCQERVTSADLDSANALRFGTRTACRKCVPDLLASLTAQERKDLVSRVQSPKKPVTARFVVPAPPRPKAYAVAPTGRSKQILIAVLGGVVVVILIVIALLMDGSGGHPPAREPAGGPTPRAPEESSRDRAAREAITRAKSISSSDPEAQLAAFEQAVRAAEGTSREREAKELRDEFLALRRKAFVKELAAVEERARALLQKEEYGAALTIFDAVRALHPGPEWNGLVDAKVQEIRKAADLVYAPLQEQAAAARSKGAEAEVKSLRERIGKWGLADKLADLDSHLKNLASRVPKPDGWQWVPLFDGKSLDFLVGGGEGAWVVENGALVHVKERKSSAQTKRQFTDGDFRIRFKFRKCHHVGFAVRQAAEGYHFAALNGADLDQLDDREHELFIICRGAAVSATLDDKPFPVTLESKPPVKGPLQFNAYGEYFAIKTLEFREPLESIEPVAHWTFDAPADGRVADVSGKGNAGTLVGGPIPTAGRIGGALQFDGRRSHVAVAHSASLSFTGPFTIAAWIKPVGASDPNMARAIVEKWDGPTSDSMSGYLLRITTKGHGHFMVRDGTKYSEVASVKPIPIDVWTHLAATFDGTNVKLYVNGVLDRTMSSTVSPAASTAPLRIGMGGGGGAHYFNGSIDDVRLYSRALSLEEIARLAGR